MFNKIKKDNIKISTGIKKEINNKSSKISKRKYALNYNIQTFQTEIIINTLCRRKKKEKK